MRTWFLICFAFCLFLSVTTAIARGLAARTNNDIRFSHSAGVRTRRRCTPPNVHTSDTGTCNRYVNSAAALVVRGEDRPPSRRPSTVWNALLTP
jgi:hypothetical protein